MGIRSLGLRSERGGEEGGLGLSETAMVRGRRCRRGEGQDRVAVDVAHCAGFATPVIGVILDDAQGIDPEVAEAEPAGEVDGVSEGGREADPGDVGPVLGQGRDRCPAGHLVVAPAVAEADIVASYRATGFNEPDILARGTDIDDAAGEEGRVDGAAVVIALTFFEPRFDSGDRLFRPCVSRQVSAGTREDS